MGLEDRVTSKIMDLASNRVTRVRNVLTALAGIRRAKVSGMKNASLGTAILTLKSYLARCQAVLETRQDVEMWIGDFGADKGPDLFYSPVGFEAIKDQLIDAICEDHNVSR